MRDRTYVILLSILLVCAAGAYGQSGSSVVAPEVSIGNRLTTLINEDAPVPLGRAVHIFVDPTTALGPQDVDISRFVRLDADGIQLPRSGAVWFSVFVQNQTGVSSWILENAGTLETVRLYYRDAGGAMVSSSYTEAGTTGDSIPFRDKPLSSRYPAFYLTIEPDTTIELLIRADDLQSSAVEFSLYPVAAYVSRLVNRNIWVGLAFGFCAALVIYNFIVFTLNGDRAYLLYSLYMGAFIANQSAQERLFARFLIPGQAYGFLWFVLFAGATAVFGILFIRQFLETRVRMPLIDRTMLLIAVATGTLMVVALFGAGPIHADVLNVLSLLAMVAILAAIVGRIRGGYGPAVTCLIGSLAYFIGTGVEIVSTFVDMPVGWFVQNAQLAGALAQVLILSTALGQKTRELSRDFDSIQTRFTQSLEHEVKERTKDLEEANRRLSHYAKTDPLTGVYNRGELDNRIAEHENLRRRVLESNQVYDFACAFIDVDNFKHHNDTFGHRSGDGALVAVASALKQSVRGYDLVFRSGGDEFIVIMPNTRTEDAIQMASRIIAAVRTACRPLNKELSCSAGVAGADLDRAASVAELIHLADTALLKAKRSNKGDVSVAIVPPSDGNRGFHDD